MLNEGASMYASEIAPSQSVLSERPIRVMVVDDSAVVRGLVSRWIEAEPGLEVVARHANGKLAVEDVARSAPDIVLLDIEMPVMDGLEALPLLLKARPGLRVLMVSTLTKRNAEISFKALALGAIDYVPKPDSNREITIEPDFRREVIEKIKVLGPLKLRRKGADIPGSAAATLGDVGQENRSFRRRAFSLVPPRVIAIGSSTGGPQALGSLLGALSPSLSRIAVLVAQHMPPMFTTVLAERLARATGLDAREGRDGERLEPGAIYVAPGDRHMTVARREAPCLRIAGGPPVNF
ncbi:MAG: chemotaxis protein CheB, partial [Methyloceanibacter sp.]